MKLSNFSIRFFTHIPALLMLGLLASAGSLLSANAQSTDSGVAQKMFATPDDAIKALQAATAANDKSALHEIFGPDVDGLLTGDAVQDANNAQRFAAAMAQSCNPVKDDTGNITLEVGTNDWPMPVPLVQTNGQWYFDTAAGKEEVINRHIGKDELNAIGVCRDYVKAQEQYATMNPAGNAGTNYALHFKSTAGKKDGLYWPVADNTEPASPFGPLVAEAAAEGYGHSEGSGRKPFHGYYFRILTCQGDAAPGGKMNYLTHGELTGGFALLAYPENWDKSGIMTFIVGQDGQVYQQNLGEKTARLVRKIKAYNPDSDWTLVPDEGVTDAALEK
jgi:hypothetical protein